MDNVQSDEGQPRGALQKLDAQAGRRMARPRNRRPRAERLVPSAVVPAAATSTAVAAPASSATPGTLLHGAGLVHRQATSPEFLLMKLGDRFLSLLGGGHFHEAETARLPGRAILDDVDRNHGARFGEMVLQVILRDVVVDISDE